MNREHPAGLGLGLRPPSGKLPQSTALLLGAAALLCPSEATSRTPARPVCGGSEAGQKAKEKEALALARRAFPGIPFKVLAYGCRHFGFSPSAPMQVPFAPFELMVQESRVTFRVKESMGLFHGPAHKEFMLLPFQTMAAAEQTARSIREVPMVRHAFGARPLYCTADLDAPGSAAYFACSSLEAPRGAITLDPQGRAPVITLRMITKHPSYARRSLLDGLFETKPAGWKGP
ncbi:MAG: hypothetical protein RBU30_25535, partial [Polyangia bacterium]|nr:hypothetical protein [Polyangia bacterium]